MTQPDQKTKTDVYTRITNQIIASIEAGAGDFQMPWHSESSVLRPVNAFNGKPYRGVNVLALWCAADEAGYSSDKWATYKQWQESGAQVKKGEKSSSIVFWKIFDPQQPDEAAPAPQGAAGEEHNRRMMARSYSVFNAEQVEGYQAPPAPQPRPEVQRVGHADAFFQSLGAEIRHGGGRAYYKPSTDHIQMPDFAAFRDALSYYAILGHESIHWTGAEKRLHRDMSGRFGNESYAAEELVAELGAAFLCADLGLSNEPRPDHAAYAASWLKVLKKDNRAIFTAAAKAQQAVDFAHSLQPQPTGDPSPDDGEEPAFAVAPIAVAPHKARQLSLGF